MQQVMNKINESCRIIEDAWYCSGKERVNQMPFITRSALIDYIITTKKIKEKTDKGMSAADITKEFGISTNFRGFIYDFEDDAKRTGYAYSSDPQSVYYVAKFLDSIGYQIKKNPEKAKELMASFEPQEMEPYEAPWASDMDEDEFELDTAKKIKKHDPEAWKKEINERKKRR